MSQLSLPGVVALATLLAAASPHAAAAQQASPPPPAAPSTPAPQTSASQTPAGVVATTNNPNLSVATVKLDQGSRISRIIGAAVHDDANQRIGTIDDLVMTEGNRVTMAVIATGGFLGVGAKLVAVPWPQLRMDGDRLVLPGATPDILNAMPALTY